MKKLLFLALFSTSSLFGIEIDGVIYNHDTDYSYKDFSYRDFIDDIKVDLSGKVIAGSVFYREQPGSIIFPETMTGVTFVKCNLDNIVIPPGNVLIECENKTWSAQKDGEDWIVDKGSPVEPVTKDKFIELGISVDPADIPKEKLKEPITSIKNREKEKEKQIIKLQEEIVELQKPEPSPIVDQVVDPIDTPVEAPK
jgi:hypothetical protein